MNSNTVVGSVSGENSSFNKAIRDGRAVAVPINICLVKFYMKTPNLGVFGIHEYRETIVKRHLVDEQLLSNNGIVANDTVLDMESHATGVVFYMNPTTASVRFADGTEKHIPYSNLTKLH